MGARTRLRRLVAVGGAVAAVAAGMLVAAPAVSASTIVDGLAVTFPTAPAVTGSDVSLTYKVNRSSDQIRRRVCALKLGTTKVAADCGTLPASTRPTSVTVGFTGLADGSYTYVVKVTDTTGATARASKKFTIDAGPYPQSRADCESLGGTFNAPGPSPDAIWNCTGVTDGTRDDAVNLLLPDCLLVDGGTTFSYTIGPPPWAFNCFVTPV